MRGAKLRWPVFVGIFGVACAFGSFARADAPAGHFTSANGTVYDTKTKLTWQQLATTTLYQWGPANTAGTAQNYCAAVLNLNGTGWRLPTIGELSSLLDHSKTGSGQVKIDTTFFPNAAGTVFWTATGSAAGGNNAWVIDFSTGVGSLEYFAGGGTAAVRCVR